LAIGNGIYIPIAKLPDLFLILGSAGRCQKNHCFCKILCDEKLFSNNFLVADFMMKNPKGSLF
jgi:hypothetical protein